MKTREMMIIMKMLMATDLHQGKIFYQDLVQVIVINYVLFLVDTMRY